MTLSRTAGYAILAMAFLAAQPAKKLCKVHDIGAALNIPPYFLSKILCSLRRRGLLHAVRGSRGGYRLVLRPDQISAMSILQALGEKPENDQCVLYLGRCTEENPCRLHDKWTRLRQQFFELVETTTLADLADCPDSNLKHPSGRRENVYA